MNGTVGEDDAVWSGHWSVPTAPVEDVDQTLVWLLRRMMDEWGPLGVQHAVDRIVDAEMGIERCPVCWLTMDEAGPHIHPAPTPTPGRTEGSPDAS